MKLHQGTFRLEIRKIFFTERPPREAVMALRLSNLKSIWLMLLVIWFSFR